MTSAENINSTSPFCPPPKGSAGGRIATPGFYLLEALDLRKGRPWLCGLYKFTGRVSNECHDFGMLIVILCNDLNSYIESVARQVTDFLQTSYKGRPLCKDQEMTNLWLLCILVAMATGSKYEKIVIFDVFEPLVCSDIAGN